MPSALSAVHPQYANMVENWKIVRDCYAGETAIKEAGQDYLPPTSGMILDGMNTGQAGFKAYEAYKLRAVWQDLYREAVQGYVGMLWSKPPTIKLPAGMEGVVSNQGESPEVLLRRINEEQLVTSRVGLLVDLPVNPDPTNPLPYIAMYQGENVRNWDTNEQNSNRLNLKYVVLDESGYMRFGNVDDPFSWNVQTRFRVCVLGDIMDPTSIDNIYRAALYTTQGGGGKGGAPDFDPSLLTPPMLRGKMLNEIPFVFINSMGNLPVIDEPCMVGLARMMIAIYRGEADYRQNLFMQGQDTLVTIGGVKMADASDPDKPLRTGAGSRIDMEAGGDAKYIGVNSSGLPEQRNALANDRTRAEMRAGQLINAKVGDKESGEALKTRLAAQTATLTSIALSGAAGLEQAYKHAARWMGKDPNQVMIEPNEEFTSTLMTGQDMFQLMQAKDLGLPVSYESIHAYMVDRGITRKTFEQEFKAIVSEAAKTKVFMNPVKQQQDALKNKPTPGPNNNNPTGVQS